ncbi:MAG: NAD(P)/FAD-dependent oxidoreductase [Bacillota bacterium]
MYPVQQRVELEDGQQLAFDRLLLATGSSPFFPDITGIDNTDIYSFIKKNDVEEIVQRLGQGNVEQVIVVGAGLIGLKAAEALKKRGLQVTVVELADRILNRILDNESAVMVREHLEAQGIEFKLGTTVEEFLGEDNLQAVRLQSGEQLQAGLAIIAVGVRPNLIPVAGDFLAIKKGIPVDGNMMTSIEGIYAAGDVAEGYDMLSGTGGIIPIWPSAYNQGLTAGRNMAGAEITYDQGFARNSIGFFGLSMITAGIIEPRDDDQEVLIKSDPETKSYKKVILEDNRIQGYILLNQIDRAGIMTELIRKQEDIGQVKDQLLKPDFGLLDLGKKMPAL